MLQPKTASATSHSNLASQAGASLDLPLTKLLRPGFPVLGPSGSPLLHRGGPASGSPIRFGEVLSESGRTLPVATADAVSSVDFFSLFQRDGRLFSVQNFEGLVGALYITEFDAARQRQDGSLVPVDVQMIRLSDYMGAVGGHVHCSGSITPWSSHLASEEFAAPGDWQGDEMFSEKPGETTQAQKNFFDANSTSNVYRPYRYGFPVEVAVHNEDPQGKLSRIGASSYFSAERHYAMGRISHEVPLCLPDRHTCYMTDDWPAGILVSFRATRPGDLSEGELLAARARQGPSQPGVVNMTLDLEWVSLGSARDSDVAPHLGVNFKDLVDQAEPLSDASCPSGYISTNSKPAEGGHECLRIRPGMELLAGRLETRRVAAMLGATQEFSRVEGLTYDAKRNYLYAALTTVDFATLDNALNGRFDVGGRNDVRWPRNPCGCVVAIALDAQHRATSLWPLICGELRSPAGAGATEAPQEHYCAHDSIANPDNVAYSPDADGLLIAEDTDLHARSVLWLLRLGDGLEMAPGIVDPTSSKKHLTAIFVAPEGAEVSSPGYYTNVNGFAYMTLAVAHPDAGEPYPAILGPLRKCNGSSAVFNAPDSCPDAMAINAMVAKGPQELGEQTAVLRSRQRDLDAMYEARVRNSTWLGRRSAPHKEEFLTCEVGLLVNETKESCWRRKLG